jgi:hypothetical protein
MTTGYTVDTDALGAAGRAFLAAGQTLTDLGNAAVSDIDGGRTGRAWPDVAGRYQDVVRSLSDKVIDYAVATTRLGNHLGDSAGQYTVTEDAATDTFTGGN